jgi:nicotinate-nucleotide pyrophosphorylase (carboxylating)
LLEAADTLITLALAEDLGETGDVTSQAVLPETQKIRGRIIAKQAGTIAGVPLVVGTYDRIDPELHFLQHVDEGERVEPGTVICEIFGNGRSVLAGERIALNFLQRLSGIATLTAAYVEAVAGTECIILDTRKTTPGMRQLEKYAVSMGGGHNHRMGLYDEVLVKDNHIDAAGSVTAAVQAVLASPAARDLPIVVEVRTLDELAEALRLPVTRVLLDNMNEAQLRAAVTLSDGRVPLEASGNMTLDRVRVVAETGVQYISVGALTHSAPALDLSMRLALID